MTSSKLLTHSDEPDTDRVHKTKPEQEYDSYQDVWARDLSIADLLIPIAVVALFVGWELVRAPTPPIAAQAAVVRQMPTPPPPPPPPLCDGDPNFDGTC